MYKTEKIPEPPHKHPIYIGCWLDFLLESNTLNQRD